MIDAQARTTEMIETQPVVYEFPRITVPTILMIGTLDHNVFGKSWAPPEIGNQLPESSTLGDKAAARMRNARFVPLDGLGHVPQIEDPGAIPGRAAPGAQRRAQLSARAAVDPYLSRSL